MLRLLISLAVLAQVAPAAAAPEPVAKQKKTKKPARKKKLSKREARLAKKTFSRSIEAKRYYDGLPPGFAWPPTRAMDDASAACTAKLDRLGVAWQSAPRPGRVAAPIVITDGMLGGIKYTNMFGPSANSVMDCQLALALATIGPELHVLGVRQVKFGSIYDQSYIKTPRGRVLSRHAIAVAMDIGSFVDETGRDIRVVESYKGGDNLLLAIEELFIASSDFHNIITPHNDPISHDNHFHVEAVVDFRRPAAIDQS